MRHYLWNPTEPIPYSDVPGGFILRGQVTPVLPCPRWDRAEDVPSGMQKNVRGRKLDEDGTSVPEEALYDIPAHHIFLDIQEKYASRGVRELAALAGYTVEQVLALDIDRKFFPNGTPVSYSEQRKVINDAAQRLAGDPQFEVYRKIAQDMLRMIDVATVSDNALVDTMEVQIADVNSGISTYDDPSMRAMARLERTRKDEAVNTMAANQGQVFQMLPALLQELAASRAPSLTADDLAKAFKMALDESKTPAEAPAKVQPKPAPAASKG